MDYSARLSVVLLCLVDWVTSHHMLYGHTRSYSRYTGMNELPRRTYINKVRTTFPTVPTLRLSTPNSRQTRIRNRYLGSLIRKFAKQPKTTPDTPTVVPSPLPIPTQVFPTRQQTMSSQQMNVLPFQITTPWEQFDGASTAKSELTAVQLEKARLLQLAEKLSIGNDDALETLFSLNIPNHPKYIGHIQRLADIICGVCAFHSSPNTCRDRFCNTSSSVNSTT